MIDLHLHLDGSLTAEMMIALSKIDNVLLPSYDEKQLTRYLCVSQNCESLNDYLKCFKLPSSVLQSEKSIEMAVYLLQEKLKNDGLEYAEIRFAPQLHTKKGLTQFQVVQSAINGLNKSDFNAKLILCCMRGDNNECENIETVEVASQFLHKGVVAIDLAGAEALYPTLNFKNIFDLAKSKNIPFTIHAGEADGAKSVLDAINFGAKRIGHGIRAIESEKVMSLLKEKDICLEMCPTSNLQTKAVDKIENYPLKKFIDYGINVTINTDNLTVSQTSLKHEYQLLKDKLGISEKEISILKENAKKYAFSK